VVGIGQSLDELRLGSSGIGVGHSGCMGLCSWSGDERRCEGEWGLLGDSFLYCNSDLAHQCLVSCVSLAVCKRPQRLRPDRSSCRNPKPTLAHLRVDHTPLRPHSITYFVSDTILCQLMLPGWCSPGSEHQTLAEHSHRLGLSLDFRSAAGSGSCRRAMNPLGWPESIL
jgi:hypothetical protein